MAGFGRNLLRSADSRALAGPPLHLPLLRKFLKSLETPEI